MTGFALVSARATGRGRDVDVSLFDVALHNLDYLAAWYFNGGHRQRREPRSAHLSLTPSQLYRTRDGCIFIMCNKNTFWPLFCDKLGRPAPASDPRFHDFKARLAHRDELTELLDQIFETRNYGGLDRASVRQRAGGADIISQVGQERTSVHAMIEGQYGVKVQNVLQDIEAAEADLNLATRLGIKVGTPVLIVRRRYFDDLGNLIELAMNAHPADRFRYETTLQRRGGGDSG